MSFWEENKDALKKAGIATAKGIGQGTKALSMAGYKTYKKHEADKKGLPQPELDRSPSAPVTELLQIAPADLGSLPLPPKRNVPARAIPTRMGTSEEQSQGPGQTAGKSQLAPVKPLQPIHSKIPQPVQPVQPIQQVQQAQQFKNPSSFQELAPQTVPLQPRLPAPPAKSSQSLQEDLTNRFSSALSQTVTRATTQAINQGVQDIQTGYWGLPAHQAPQAQAAAPPPRQQALQQPLPQLPLYTQPLQPVEVVQPQAQPFQAQQAQQSGPTVKEYTMPAPAVKEKAQLSKTVDLSAFAPPPIHVDIRDKKAGASPATQPSGMSNSAQLSSGAQESCVPGSNGATSPSSAPISSAPPPVAPRAPTVDHLWSKRQSKHKPVKFVDIDVNKFGPPPPKPFRAPEAASPSQAMPGALPMAPPRYSPNPESSGDISAPPSSQSACHHKLLHLSMTNMWMM